MNKFFQSFRIPLLLNFLVLGIVSTHYFYFKETSDKKSTQSIIKKYNKFLNKRNIATSSNDGFECVDEKEVLSIEYISKKITELELSKTQDKQIKETIKGMDLSKLSYPQAAAIKKYSQYMGKYNSKEEIFKDCDSYMCAVNTIYNDPESQIYGYLHYYFYLKTGLFINLSNYVIDQKSTVPGVYDGNTYEFDKYLFTKEELIGFYKLARSISDIFLVNDRFHMIYKSPTTKFENYEIGTCGLAYSQGYVKLTTRCLSFSKYADGGFYHNVSHEFAHQTDFKSYFDGVRAADMESWKKIAGWETENYYDEDSKKTLKRWKVSIADSDFITPYAGTTPYEHFAESMAAYRYGEPYNSRKFHKETFNYLKNNYFDKVEYKNQGLALSFTQFLISDWEKQLNDTTLNCVEREDVKDAKSTINCIKKSSDKFIQEHPAKIKTNFFDGCRFYSDIKNTDLVVKLENDIQSLIDKNMDKIEQEFISHGEGLIKAAQLESEFKKNNDAISLYINCFKTKNAEACFNKTLNENIDQLLAKTNLAVSLKDKVKNNLLKSYSFSETEKTIKLKSQALLGFYQSQVDDKVENSWHSCMKLPLDTNEPLLTDLFFNGDDKFIAASFLNCLNKNIEEDIIEILELPFIEDKDLTLSRSEKQFFKDKLQNYSLQLLNILTHSEYQKEVSNNNTYFKTKHTFLISKIKEKIDLKTVEPQNIPTKCIELIKADYPKNIFHSKIMLDGLYGNPICKEGLKGLKEEITQKYNEKWDSILIDYKNKAKSLTLESINRCQNKYPAVVDKDYLKNKKLQTSCIDKIEKEAETEIMSQWDNSAESQYLNKRSTLLISIQTVILKELDKARAGQKKTLKF